MTDTTAIVTGGSRGIGRDAVLCLARQGVRTIFTFNRAQTEADRVVGLAAEAGATAQAIQLDVSDASAFPRFTQSVRAVLAAFGTERFDFLVNNAGTSSTATLLDATEADLDEQFAVHFKAPFLLTQHLLPLMRDGGRIVNISSGLARFTVPGRAVYGPMKAAVEALTRSMAVELASRRIAVNVVAPGPIATDFSNGAVRDNPAIAAALASHTALGRVGGPEDVGPVIAALLSEQMRWVNAQRIEVAGGIHI